MNYSKHSLLFSIIFISCLTFSSSLNSASPALEFFPTYQLLLTSTYELQAADAGIIAREADRWQAGNRPNPALTVNLTSIGRDQDGDENQLFVGITQLVELGNKRTARLRVAGATQCSSQWDLEIAKTELFAKLLHAFIAMAAAQERTNIASCQQKTAQQTIEAINAKTAAGNLAGIEEKKAQLTFRTANLDYLKQRANLQKTKKELLALWSDDPPEFDTVCFPLNQLSPPPPLEPLIAAQKSSPVLIKAEAETALAGEIVGLERSKRIPDLAFQVGVLTEKFVEQPALCVGFGMPLPLFDQNEGNVSRASYEQLQAVYKQLDLENDLRSALEVVYLEWTSAYEQAIFLKDAILPAAESTLQFAQTGYDEGKFDYLDLLDARNTVFNTQLQYLEAIEEYHHKRAEVLKLTAAYSLEEI